MHCQEIKNQIESGHMKEAVTTESAQHTHESGQERCIFCEIVRGKAEASIIARHKQALAIMDLHDYPLIIPQAHITDISEENLEAVHDTYELAHRLEAVIRKEDPQSGVILFTNRGENAGQEIDHFHVHALIQRHGERKLRLHNVPIVARDQLNQHAQKIRQLYDASYTPMQDRVVADFGK
jgi:histidine triad (HIT) family protein